MTLMRLFGPGGKIPVLIRDDDTSFFTKPNMLESIYSKAWTYGFKVSLSTVPFTRGINDISVPPEFRKTYLYYRIGDNEALTKYLRYKIHDEGSVEILQHGYSHDHGEEPYRWEFGNDSKESLRTREQIQHGKKIIEDAFGFEAKFFVPPGEDVSPRNLEIIFESGLIPIYRQSLYDTIIRNSIIPNAMKRIVLKCVTKKYYGSTTREEGSWASLVRPVGLSVRNKAITWSSSTFNTGTNKPLPDLTDRIIGSSRVNRSPICILNHYHYYYHDWHRSITKNELFRAWTKILDCLKEVSYWKVTFSELYERVQKIRAINISRTGAKITLESKVDVRDFSFMIKHPLEPNINVVRDEQTNIMTIKHMLPNDKIVLYEKI